jgi:hypothetical protein
MTWLFKHRPEWVGKLAIWYFDSGLWMPYHWPPYVLGIGLASSPHRVVNYPGAQASVGG